MMGRHVHDFVFDDSHQDLSLQRELDAQGKLGRAQVQGDADIQEGHLEDERRRSDQVENQRVIADDRSTRMADAAHESNQALLKDVTSRQTAMASSPTPYKSRITGQYTVAATWSLLFAGVITFWIFAIIGIWHVLDLLA